MTSRPAGAPRARRHQLAAELRRTRMRAGLSGRNLAQATGVSQSTISRAERGQAVERAPNRTFRSKAPPLTLASIACTRSRSPQSAPMMRSIE